MVVIVGCEHYLTNSVQNLRARLRNKDKLVEQLTADHTTLRSEMTALQTELSESKVGLFPFVLDAVERNTCG